MGRDNLLGFSLPVHGDGLWREEGRREPRRRKEEEKEEIRGAKQVKPWTGGEATLPLDVKVARGANPR